MVLVSIGILRVVVAILNLVFYLMAQFIANDETNDADNQRGIGNVPYRLLLAGLHNSSATAAIPAGKLFANIGDAMLLSRSGTWRQPRSSWNVSCHIRCHGVGKNSGID